MKSRLKACLTLAALAAGSCVLESEPRLGVVDEDTEISTGLITGEHIADGTVDTADLADGSVTSDKLAEGAVDWSAIANIPAGFADGVDDVGTGALTTHSCPAGQVANGYDAAADELTCVADIDTNLSEAEVEGHITDEPIDLAVGSTVGSADISTGPHTTSLPWGSITSIPAGFADGTDDTSTTTSVDGLTGGIITSDTTISGNLTVTGNLDVAGTLTVGGVTIGSCPAGMVPVGDFCVDEYEAVIVDAAYWNGGACDGGGVVYGNDPTNDCAVTDDYPPEFPDNGNWTTPLYACSVPGVIPSRCMTWFQAQQACINSGKHLITNAEWQAAAAGTPDDSGSCNISTSGPEVTGNRAACVSNHGAFDMVGNLWEWVSLWEMEPGWNGTASIWADVAAGGPGATYGSDGYWHGGDASEPAHGSTGSHEVWNGEAGARLPAAAVRGGFWNAWTEAGVFAVTLYNGPSTWDASYGFRCARRK